MGVPKAPFPQRLLSQKKKMDMKQFEEIKEIFKSFTINVPFLSAIQGMPSYVKFLKDLCTQKRTQMVMKDAFFSEPITDHFLDNGIVKYKDLGRPTLICNIGNNVEYRCLLDLGASVNILLTHIYNTMGLAEYKPTNLRLQLADRSTKQCRGVVEDVLVKCLNFFYPVDFVVLDTDDTPDSVLIILGRPFLATSDALIQCRSRKM